VCSQIDQLCKGVLPRGTFFPDYISIITAFFHYCFFLPSRLGAGQIPAIARRGADPLRSRAGGAELRAGTLFPPEAVHVPWRSDCTHFLIYYYMILLLIINIIINYY
jgi:hypothetical protein